MVFDNVENRGMLYGDGIFETMRVGPRGVWEMEAHIDRLAKTAAFFGLTELCTKVISKIRILKTKETCLVRLTILREDGGPFPGSEGGVFWNQRALPNISARRLIGLKGLYLPGYKLHEFKTTSYLRSIYCKNKAHSLGYSDGLMLSDDGYVGETSTCNIWAVFDDCVVTPKVSGLLPGIVRAKILQKDLGGLPIQERALKLSELLDAREIGMSSVGVGVVAARSLHYQGRHFSLQNHWSKTIEAELFRG